MRGEVFSHHAMVKLDTLTALSSLLDLTQVENLLKLNQTLTEQIDTVIGLNSTIQGKCVSGSKYNTLLLQFIEKQKQFLPPLF